MFSTDTLIHPDTRAEALADGVLFDVTEAASLVGFELPVALTRAVWVDILGGNAATGLSLPLHRLLACARVLPLTRGRTREVRFASPDAWGGVAELRLRLHHGDAAEWVATILRAWED